MSWVPNNLTQLCTSGSSASICQPNTLLFLQLVYSLFSSTKNSKNPVNSNSKPKEYDFIIVGGGTAGCILANRLTEIKDWNVLLLEAGIEEPNVTSIPSFMPLLQKTNIDWNFKTQPEKSACLATNGCHLPSGKVMGGTSSINGMLYVRGNRKDYDNWHDLGNTDWSYDDILRYFKKSEKNRDEEIFDDSDYHGTSGYQSVQRFPYVDKNLKIIHKALRSVGHQSVDVNGESQLGSMILQTTSYEGQRQSTNKAFIRPIRRNRPNLFIETEAYVTRVVIDPITKKATGVEYTLTSNNNTKSVAMAKREIIVSAGTIKSPQLLMVSGIGPSEELEKHKIRLIRNASVGANLQDHLQFTGVYILIDNKTATQTTFSQKKMDLDFYLKSRKGPLSAEGVATVVAFTQTEYEDSDEKPDIQLCFTGMNIGDKTVGPVTAYYDALNFYPILLAPKSRGYIKLNETDPVWGAPLIYPGYLTHDRDVARMIEGVRKGLKLFETEEFEDNNYKLYTVPQAPCQNLEFNSDDYWTCMLRSHTGAGAHGVGTCKMGPDDDEEAIVDPRLRVYGVKRLRVVDASIMPVIPRGNLMAPTMMVAEKASDMIKEDWLDD